MRFAEAGPHAHRDHGYHEKAKQAKRDHRGMPGLMGVQQDAAHDRPAKRADTKKTFIDPMEAARWPTK
jgi:hypothetical protein